MEQVDNGFTLEVTNAIFLSDMLKKFRISKCFGYL